MHLIKCCHKRTYIQDPIIRDIVVHYDFVTAIKPYLKSNIKYYSIPHYFILKAIHPRIAIMQHMMFSFNQTLLPIPTDKSISSRDELLDSLVDSINMSKSFSIINGKFAIKEKFGFTSSGKVKRKQIDDSANFNKEKVSNNKNNQLQREESLSEIEIDGNSDDSSVASILFGNKKKSQELTSLNELMPSLEVLSLESVIQQEQRMEDEAKGKKPKITKNYKVPYISDVKKTLSKTSNADSGYIVWLSTKRTLSDKTDTNRWRDLIIPKPFDFKEILSDDINELLIEEEAIKQFQFKEFSNLPSGHDNNVKNIRAAQRSISESKESDGEFMSSDPFSARNRRVYKAATEIATTAKWVLNQVRLGIFAKYETIVDFHKELTSNFQTAYFNKKEIEWYESRNTAEKVLRLAQNEYDKAPKWEPLPINALSPEDLKNIQDAELKYKEHVEIAQAMGQAALVKLGHDFKDGQQIVSYGQNKKASSIQLISKAFQDVRANSKSKDRNLMKAPKEINYYLCDVESCEVTVCTSDKVKCCNEFRKGNSFRKGLRFCSEHLEHEKHIGIKKRFKRQLVDKNKYNIPLK